MREVTIENLNDSKQLPETSAACEILSHNKCVDCICLEFVVPGKPCAYGMLLQKYQSVPTDRRKWVPQHTTMVIPETIEECLHLKCDKCAVHLCMSVDTLCTYRQMLNLVVPPGEKQ